MRKDWKKHIGTAIFVVFAILILFVPAAKAKFIQGLIEIGLFNPSVGDKKTTAVSDLSAIKFADEKGNVVSLADLKGKVVFVNFWATWCPPCLAEMPSINKFHQQFENDNEVVFLMVNADGDFPKSRDYIARKKYKFKTYAFASSMPKNIFAGSLPTTVVFDKQGRIAMHGEGPKNYGSKKFITFIKQLKELKD